MVNQIAMSPEAIPGTVELDDRDAANFLGGFQVQAFDSSGKFIGQSQSSQNDDIQLPFGFVTGFPTTGNVAGLNSPQSGTGKAGVGTTRGGKIDSIKIVNPPSNNSKFAVQFSKGSIGANSDKFGNARGPLSPNRKYDIPSDVSNLSSFNGIFGEIGS